MSRATKSGFNNEHFTHEEHAQSEGNTLETELCLSNRLPEAVHNSNSNSPPNNVILTKPLHSPWAEVEYRDTGPNQRQMIARMDGLPAPFDG
ncbi:hypothetical protein BaRGS_00023935 [Batillaria attramentaria]|uniref:Uncharacterized protein n=1 Tax=Batillaria attramentaria TaxID=370345 RepID=A0ABD0KCY9_9CAEN